jgi:hypothetical protein
MSGDDKPDDAGIPEASKTPTQVPPMPRPEPSPLDIVKDTPIGSGRMLGILNKLPKRDIDV